MLKEQSEQITPRHERTPARITLTFKGFALMIGVNMIVLVVLGLPIIRARLNFPGFVFLDTPTETATDTATPQPTETLTPIPTDTPTASATSSIRGVRQDWSHGGALILAISEGVDTHLFAYRPLGPPDGSSLPLTRLTVGPWNDITPAISLDGKHLAFASNRDGGWDLYSMDLVTAEVTRLTRNLEYEAAPTWSPDGLWLAYEAYVDANLEVFIKQIDGDEQSIRLTNHPGADFAPAWSPRGRQIAFISTRDGIKRVWLADLDQTGEKRFTLLSRNGETQASHPAWSPNGRYLVYGATDRDGIHTLYIWDGDQPQHPPRRFGSGSWPVWGLDGNIVLTTLITPEKTYLTGYPLDTPGTVALPALSLPGPVEGMAWTDASLTSNLVGQTAQITPTPLWLPALTQKPGASNGRRNVVTLEDVDAPYPQLHDMVDESFRALRDFTAEEAGWDILASLENAYVPLTTALAPGMLSDWLYTGRAFALNTLPINAGWMAVVREDFAHETYWRVFLRARFQDGSQGRPLHHLPWDFNARYQGEPRPYEQGGELYQYVPPGYWVDFTRLAEAYGWKRLSALSNWRSAYPAARFNEFVHNDGLDWDAAMLELYPAEVLITPTAIVPPTRTPTSTPRWFRTSTPTPTPTLMSSSTATSGVALTPGP